MHGFFITVTAINFYKRGYRFFANTGPGNIQPFPCAVKSVNQCHGNVRKVCLNYMICTMCTVCINSRDLRKNIIITFFTLIHILIHKLDCTSFFSDTLKAISRESDVGKAVLQETAQFLAQ